MRSMLIVLVHVVAVGVFGVLWMKGIGAANAQDSEKPVGSQTTQSIRVPDAKAAELRARLDESIEAERSAELANQFCQARAWEREARRNAWIATQYKVARELSVPLGWVLQTDKMVFVPPSKATSITQQSPLKTNPD